MDDIIALLKAEDTYCRIGNGQRWMFYDNSDRAWVVMEQKYRKHTREIGRFGEDNLSAAVLMLANLDG